MWVSVSVWACAILCVCTHPCMGGGVRRGCWIPSEAFVKSLAYYIGVMVWTLALIVQHALLSTVPSFQLQEQYLVFPEVFWCPVISDFGLFLLSYDSFTYFLWLMLNLDSIIHILLPGVKGGQRYSPRTGRMGKPLCYLHLFEHKNPPDAFPLSFVLERFYPCHSQTEQ